MQILQLCEVSPKLNMALLSQKQLFEQYIIRLNIKCKEGLQNNE